MYAFGCNSFHILMVFGDFLRPNLFMSCFSISVLLLRIAHEHLGNLLLSIVAVLIPEPANALLALLPYLVKIGSYKRLRI